MAAAKDNEKRIDEDQPRIIIPGDDVRGDDHAETAEGGETIDSLRKERDEYLEAARRARADYKNLQRRMETGFANTRRDALSGLALDMLGVLDDVERAIEHAEGSDSDEGLLEGVRLVRDKFVSTLSRYGVTKIDALGEAFDHNYHDAIARQPAGEAAPGTVVAVAQTGYMMGEKLLRPARVVVAAGEDAAGEDREADGEEE
jgi:molecular chaperone GrpE